MSTVFLLLLLLLLFYLFIYSFILLFFFWSSGLPRESGWRKSSRPKMKCAIGSNRLGFGYFLVVWEGNWLKLDQDGGCWA